MARPKKIAPALITDPDLEGGTARKSGITAGYSPAERAVLVEPTNSVAYGYLRMPPGSFRMDVRAKQSNAAAHGYVYINNQAYWDLLDEMVDKDPRLDACTQLVPAFALLRTQGIEFEEKDAGHPLAEEIRTVLQRMVDTANFTYALWSLLYGCLIHGMSVVEMTWHLDKEGYLVPKQFFHAHPGQFGISRVGDMYFMPRLQTEIQPFNPNNFVLMQNPALYDNPFGKSEIYGLRYLWHFKKGDVVAWARFCRKFGTPLVHGKLPKETPDIEQKKKDFVKTLAGLGEDDAIATCLDEEIAFINRMGTQQSSAHESFVSYVDTEYAIRLLGASLSQQESKFGTRAQSVVHERTVLTKVLPQSKRISDTATHGIFAPIVRANWGPDAPVPKWMIDDNEEVTAADAQTIIDTAMKYGVEVAAKQARTMLNLRKPTKDEELLKPPPEPKPIAIPSNQDPSKPPNPGGDPPSPPGMKAPPSDNFNPKSGFALWQKAMSPALFNKDNPLSEPFLAAFSKESVAREKDLVLKNEKAAAEIAKLGVDSLKAVVEKTLAHIRRMAPSETTPLWATAKSLVDVSGANFEAPLNLMLHVAKIQAALSTQRQIEMLPGRAVAFAADDPLSGLPSGFQDAVKWMMSRGVLSKDELNQFAKALSTYLGISLGAAEDAIRQEALVLANSVNDQVTERIQTLIAASIDQELPTGVFLSAVDELVKAGTLPAGLDGYWENVLRTELTSAYSAQQQLNEQHPDVADNIWGHQTFNPNDARSRETHAHLDGALFKKGSPADAMLGWPPYSYQCRCAKAAIVVPDPRSAGFIESPNAMTLAAQLERFK